MFTTKDTTIPAGEDRALWCLGYSAGWTWVKEEASYEAIFEIAYKNLTHHLPTHVTQLLNSFYAQGYLAAVQAFFDLMQVVGQKTEDHMARVMKKEVIAAVRAETFAKDWGTAYGHEPSPEAKPDKAAYRGTARRNAGKRYWEKFGPCTAEKATGKCGAKAHEPCLHVRSGYELGQAHAGREKLCKQ